MGLPFSGGGAALAGQVRSSALFCLSVSNIPSLLGNSKGFSQISLILDWLLVVDESP